MSNKLTVSDITVLNNAPTIQDLRLGARLGYSQPIAVRKMITRNLTELQRYGEVFSKMEKTAKGGRPGTEFHLNQGQAILVTMFANTELAADVREEIITVYTSWYRGELGGEILPAHAPDPFSPAPMDRQARDLAILEHVRLTKGPAAAAALYDKMDSMPKIPPALPAPVDAEALACLRHLFAQPWEEMTVGAWIKLLFRGKAAAKSVLGRLKIELKDDGFIVPNVHEPYLVLFEGTRWERPFEVLRLLPRTKPHHPHAGKWAGQWTFIPSTYLSEA